MDAGIRSIHEKLDMLEGRLREIRVAQSHQPNERFLIGALIAVLFIVQLTIAYS